ncbi:MAG: ATP-binding protein [Reichenbachiella sp.]|uniref:ATP-binding protein n=1 Tax=Reichenbachiella sp. TaxID=2184521 RepID=UPI00326460E4
MRQDFINLVLDALVELLSGNIPITIESIEEEENDDYKEILTGLLYLHEDLTYSNKKVEDTLNELKDAKEKAEMASKAKAEFLAMMSHEMRTPLNAIIGFCHLMLSDKNVQPHQIDDLKSLKFSGEHLSSLINDLLDFNKIEAGKIVLEKIPFNLAEDVDGLIKALKVKADENNVKLKFVHDSDLPSHVVGDPTRLRQIITNLVGNAIKFTKDGSVTVSLIVDSLTDTEVGIDCLVTDTGIGIPQEKLSKIFDTFSQGDSEITRKFGGTGLGLTITKQLIELQGGTISVESEFGRGSTFRFALVYKLDTVKKARTEENHGAQDFKEIEILVVEDIPVNQVVAERFLNEWGAKADLADHGAMAVEMVQKKDYDLILMDLQMPIMDGYEATRKIRDLDEAKYRKLPIVALTASAMIDVKEGLFNAGMNDLVLKPINPSELYEKISKNLLRERKYRLTEKLKM